MIIAVTKLRGAIYIAFSVGVSASGCSGGSPKQLASQAIDIAEAVKDIDVLPSHAYVVSPDPAVHKEIRIEFVRPVLRTSLALSGFSVAHFSVNGFDAGPVAIAGVHFNDDPADVNPSGPPITIVNVDLTDPDIVANGYYTLLVNQPSIQFQGDSASGQLVFAFPPFHAAAGSRAPTWPFIAQFAPGPTTAVPGWTAPVRVADLPAMTSSTAASTAKFSFMPPHADITATFSTTMAQAIAVYDPSDPAIHLTPTPLSTTAYPIGHPVPFQKMHTQTVQGLLPAQDYSIVFLSRDSADLAPFASGTVDATGRFLGIDAAPDLQAFLGTTDDKPLDVEYRFQTSHVRIENPQLFNAVPIGLSALTIHGELPIELSFASDVATATTFATGVASIPAFQIKSGAAGGRLVSVAASTLTQAGISEQVQHVVFNQPVPLGIDGVVTITVQTYDAKGNWLGSDSWSGAMDLDQPNIKLDRNGIHDTNLTDGTIDLFCVKADEPLQTVSISANGQSETLQIANASSQTPQPDGGTEYCFRNVPVPGGAGRDGNSYTISVVGTDPSGNDSPPQTMEITCDVPPTTVVEGSVGHGDAMFLDETDTPHVIWYDYEGDTTNVIERSRDGNNGAWTELSRFTLPAGKTPAGMLSLSVSADQAIHLCVPLRLSSSDPTSERSLLYAVHPNGGNWQTESVVDSGGATNCSIVIDETKQRALIAFDGRGTPTAPRIAKLAFVPRLDGPMACSGTTCQPTIETVGDCSQAGCGQNISVALATDGQIHVVSLSPGLLAALVYDRRALDGSWSQAFVVSTDNDIFVTSSPVFTPATSPVMTIDNGQVHIFALVLNTQKTTPYSLFGFPTLVHMYRSTGATFPANEPLAFTTERLTDDLNPQPLNTVHNIESLPGTAKGMNLSVAFTPSHEYRVAFAKNGDVNGSNEEIRIAYQGLTDVTSVTTAANSDEDYSLAIDSAGHTRMIYLGDQGSELDYYQEENQIETHRAAGLPTNQTCANSRFSQMCTPVTSDILRLVPHPVSSVTAAELANITGLDNATATAEVTFFNSFLTYMAQTPIDAANGINQGLSDQVRSSPGSTESSLVEDVFRGITVKAGRVLLKNQIQVCVPDSTGVPAGQDVCDSGSGKATMDLTPSTQPISVTHQFAKKTVSATIVSGDPLAIAACLQSGGTQYVDAATSTTECVKCSDSAYAFSPKDGVCVQCLSPSAKLQAPPAGNIDSTTTQATCTGCPYDPTGVVNFAPLHTDDMSCSQCPAGAIPKKCSGNSSCEDPVNGRTGYACGADSYCELMKSCSSDADCAAGNVCQNGHCAIKPPKCTQDSDCSSPESCSNGYCVLDINFDNNAGFETDEHALLCDPLGCDVCFGNVYCTDTNSTASCPPGHHCVAGPLPSPMCILRPVFQHPLFQVAAATNTSSPLDVFSALKDLNSEGLPLHIRTVNGDTQITADTLNVAVDHATVRINASPRSQVPSLLPMAQGVVEVDVYFVGDKIEATGSGYKPGCGTGDFDAHTTDKAIFRMFFQPVIDPDKAIQGKASITGAVNFVSIGYDLVQDTTTGDPDGFKLDGADCNGNCAQSCGDLDSPAHREKVKEQVIGKLADKLQTQLTKTLSTIYQSLVVQPGVGELLFGVQSSCTQVNSVAEIEQVRLSQDRADTLFRLVEKAPPATCTLPAADPQQMCF